jgi:hypothetical protein
MEKEMADTRRTCRLPGTPHHCSFPATCVYRENGVCDDPYINNGNGDSACFKTTRWKVAEHLTPPKDKTP